MKNPAPFQQFLHSHQRLNQLLSQVQIQQTLLRQIQHLLPDTLAPHCHTATLHRAQLILAADSPVWTNRLRYQAPTLLHQLRVTHPGIASIKVHSRPLPSQAVLFTPQSRLQRTGTADQANMVYNSAKHIQDPTLSGALQRLAKTLYLQGSSGQRA